MSNDTPRTDGLYARIYSRAIVRDTVADLLEHARTLERETAQQAARIVDLESQLATALAQLKIEREAHDVLYPSIEVDGMIYGPATIREIRRLAKLDADRLFKAESALAAKTRELEEAIKALQTVRGYGASDGGTEILDYITEVADAALKAARSAPPAEQKAL